MERPTDARPLWRCAYPTPSPDCCPANPCGEFCAYVPADRDRGGSPDTDQLRSDAEWLRQWALNEANQVRADRIEDAADELDRLRDRGGSDLDALAESWRGQASASDSFDSAWATAAGNVYRACADDLDAALAARLAASPAPTGDAEPFYIDTSPEANARREVARIEAERAHGWAGVPAPSAPTGERPRAEIARDRKVLRWCAAHDEPAWLYDDGSVSCPYDLVVEARTDHEITDGPWIDAQPAHPVRPDEEGDA